MTANLHDIDRLTTLLARARAERDSWKRQASETVDALKSVEAELAEARASLTISHRDVQALLTSSDKLEAENTVYGIELDEARKQVSMSRAREARASEDELKLADNLSHAAKYLRSLEAKLIDVGADMQLDTTDAPSFQADLLDGVAAAIRERGGE